MEKSNFTISLLLVVEKLFFFAFLKHMFRSKNCIIKDNLDDLKYHTQTFGYFFFLLEEGTEVKYPTNEKNSKFQIMFFMYKVVNFNAFWKNSLT